MSLHDEVLDLLIRETGYSGEMIDDMCVHNDLQMYGDDFHELIEAYAKEFNVDMMGYLWYFHADEEAPNLGRLFFKTPYDLVDRIAVTPEILIRCAEKKKWDIEYPIHELPKRRYDLWINFICATAVLWIAVICAVWTVIND